VYDAVGNRTSKARPAGTTAYTYNAADQLTSADGPAGTTAYDYDVNGNQTQAGPRTFAYDLAGWLTSTTQSATTITYGYDGDGNRLSASSGMLDSQKTKYLWDVNTGLPQLVLERDGAGAGAGTAQRIYLYGNGRIAMQAGGARHYFHYDGLGSVMNVTSPSGGKEWSYSYEPFGAEKTTTKDDPAAPATCSASPASCSTRPASTTYAHGSTTPAPGASSAWTRSRTTR
jgi:YD repeat-containing protein